MRARNIKNQAKVNRDYTVPELLKLLEKAEKDLEISKFKIKALEKIIIDLGGTLPKDDELETEIMKEKEEEEEDNFEEEK